MRALGPVKDNFTGSSGFHHSQAFGKICGVEMVGDHLTCVESVLKHCDHLLPRLETLNLRRPPIKNRQLFHCAATVRLTIQKSDTWNEMS
mgnify:FL=1